MTVKDSILTNMLDCGAADLVMLEDIGYDVIEIIEELQESDSLSLNEIFRVVFEKAKTELVDALKEQKDEIKSCIEYELETAMKECLEDGMTEEEVKNDDEYISLLKDLELLESGELQPKEDITYYLNCMDTHVYLSNLDFYQRYMENTIDDIEDKMGFSFQNN